MIVAVRKGRNEVERAWSRVWERQLRLDEVTS